MSSVGSGRSYRTRPMTNELPALDIASFNTRSAEHQRAKVLIWQQNGRVVGTATYVLSGENLRLAFKSHDGRSTSADIQLTNTSPHFGGVRRWFVCPDCARRNRILYFEIYFRCRKCVSAVYPSQYDYLRLAGEAKAKRARDLVAAHPGFNGFLATKPKGMHWRTYRKLEREIYEADTVFERYVQGRLR